MQWSFLNELCWSMIVAKIRAKLTIECLADRECVSDYIKSFKISVISFIFAVSTRFLIILFHIGKSQKQRRNIGKFQNLYDISLTVSVNLLIGVYISNLYFILTLNRCRLQHYFSVKSVRSFLCTSAFLRVATRLFSSSM